MQATKIIQYRHISHQPLRCIWIGYVITSGHVRYIRFESKYWIHTVRGSVGFHDYIRAGELT